MKKTLCSSLIAHAESSLLRHFRQLDSSPYSLKDLPTMSFDQRGAVAGSALLQKNHIRINPKLIQDNLDYFLQEVIPHELAHLAVYQKHGRVRPHGKEWQWVMNEVFHLPATRCHELATTSLSSHQFIYTCGCGELALTIRRHNKVQRGQTQYSCRRCKQVLVYCAS